jgi:hypothetical protein
VICAKRKTRWAIACSRIFFNMRAPEKLSFSRPQVIYARFSLSRIEPVPFAPSSVLVPQIAHDPVLREGPLNSSAATGTTLIADLSRSERARSTRCLHIFERTEPRYIKPL